MGKNPAFQFYPCDWLSDTELQMASAASRGIWANLLSHMWTARDRGKVAGTVDQLSKLGNCTTGECEKFLSEATLLQFADVTKRNNEVTVANRRMLREQKARELTRLRVQKFRNAHCNADITPPSSSSSSSITKKTPQDVTSFEIFWSVYPKHRNKPAAIRAFVKIAPDATLFERIISRLQLWKSCSDWAKDNGQFIPYPATFLNGRQWEDDIPNNGFPSTGKQQSFLPEAWHCKKCGGIHSTKPGDVRTCDKQETKI